MSRILFVGEVDKSNSSFVAADPAGSGSAATLMLGSFPGNCCELIASIL
jgi:hypothetical protein